MILLTIFVSSFMYFGPTKISAQNTQTDPRFNTPAREMSAPKIGTIPQSSGYVDQNGNPLSREEYEKIQNKKTGIQWDHIFQLLVVIGVIVGGIVVLVKLTKRKKRSDLNPSFPMQQQVSSSVPNQNPAAQNIYSQGLPSSPGVNPVSQPSQQAGGPLDVTMRQPLDTAVQTVTQLPQSPQQPAQPINQNFVNEQQSQVQNNVENK